MILLDSNLLAGIISGVATIITGAGAILIYFQQKADAKVQAARVLLTEIRTAEERIEQIRDRIANNSSNDLPLVFPSKSWKMYSHLFISDFDVDELKLISSFYDYGELLEEFARRDNDFFWVTTDEKARVLQQKLGEIIVNASDLDVSLDQKHSYIRERKVFLQSAFDEFGLVYTPKKTVDEIKIYLEKIKPITTSSCGLKIKKIAEL